MNHTAELKYTIGRLDHLPADGKKQFVLSGRSNVGKSSLINTLLNRNKLARISSVPGKTITINMYLVDDDFYFSDLPGYGFAKRPYAEKEQWSKLVDGFLGKVSDGSVNACAVIQLVDLKVGPTKDDIQILEYLNYYDIPYFIVATKSDKLNVGDKAKAIKKLEDCEYIREGTAIIPFSALKNTGTSEIWTEINRYL